MRPRNLLFVLITLSCALTASAQFGNLKKKLKQELTNNDKKEVETKKPQPAKSELKPEVAEKSELPEKKEKPSIAKEVSKLQANEVANGVAMKVVNEYGSAFGGDKTEIPNGYLTFSNDYTFADGPKEVMEPNDFIYAKVDLPKKITSYLPTKDHQYIEYYRVKVEAEIDEGRGWGENSHKIPYKDAFEIAYGKEGSVIVPIVPGKGFYENILNQYRDENGQYDDVEEEIAAYKDVTARNFSRQIADAFGRLDPGQHQVKVTFSVTAKLNRSYYEQVDEIEGYFTLTVDEKSIEKHKAAYDLLTGLYNDHYMGELSVAHSKQNREKEEEMLAEMDEEHRRAYLIAKKSQDGYLAAYEGPKHTLTFKLDGTRSKTAYVDMRWADGSEPNQVGATHSFQVTKGSVVKKDVPAGTKVSINGRTIVPSSSEAKTVTLYWYY